MGAAEDDTDSVASSYTAPGNTWGIPGNTAGFPGNTSGNTSGISPLNRHRLNRKPGEVTMEATVAPPPALLTRVSTTYFLRSQMASTNLERSDTVAMQSPGVSTLQKMDTMGKWESWREEPSAMVIYYIVQHNSTTYACGLCFVVSYAMKPIISPFSPE